MRGFHVIIGAALLASCTSAPREEAPRAEVDADWPSIPTDAIFGQPSAVDIDSHGHVFVLHRAGREWEEPFTTKPIAEDTVFMFSQEGQLLARWGAGQFIMPHGLSVDAEDDIWITDVAREQVLRFSHDGEEELVMGVRGESGEDSGHFGRPADVDFLGDRVLVADGYVNTRVALFDREGKYLGEWGGPGEDAGELDLPHAVSTDGERVYVADRENARISVFSTEGEPLGQWRGLERGHTYSVKPLGGGWVLAVEGRDMLDRTGAMVRVYRPDGTVERSFDLALEGEGASLGHDIALDSAGRAYMIDVYGNRVIRFGVDAPAGGAGD
ncbi:peptidyl-alpha-hydroxyglycine alpha-amidating lyase family protein [Qipengyuania gaetbuli]|uniref:peptidyl-alpha-hydroxyglycine alpha-amidating lyase family protein n=1 Tax=Qipengyuania gaetbuli TaxID=266952 RepID=UPI001CD1B3B9|nr:peptidyl-alpha-hydroxyglycine alpha-amidating lyase family protein [Qipengyuania gaetbuli]MCA0909229.1 peptidyl-alpha-hydroxyglycine alpha-amidating lyase family protein [Qipengyuania gaetbuli]